MARLAVLEYPDPRLRQRSEPVGVFDADLGALVDDLVETLRGTTAIGLSAPQVGVLQAVLALDLSEERTSAEVYINPEILRRGAWGFVEESCLSVPGVVTNVIRATQVRVRAQNRHGETFERDLEGMRAVALQHEMDHLRGRLLVDRLWWLRRMRVRAAAMKRRARAATP
ncbi:MAG: peptide deformylase [Sandaracinaceae bacterium]